ncbi:hypothetical protein [Ruegeria marina]|uniref:Uncharacterized protein n=1 Tax=Ruegeria marina TaxID=639004 RepID=A0A1G7C440_9RHOB|nr:hypothetical protein [Ruegeria marina]SDE33195.1 hypothetical protein SAMN04488239_11766 [Ruegeria marina]
MKSLFVTATIASFAFAPVVFADATNGKGSSKGGEGVAVAVTSEPGTANAASGLIGGWGSVGGVSNGRGAEPK